MPDRIARRLLVIGWDAADWKIIDPLLAQGLMPNLKRMIDNGVRGDITSLDPKLSPLLWTTVATGKTADKHGILNFIEPDAGSGGQAAGLRIVTSTSRKTKALWNILSQNGLATGVVAWYATHPAEPIRGTVVSNLFLEGLPPEIDQPWPIAPGAVHPAADTQRIADLRLHPAELSGEEMLALLPDLPKMDPRDRRIQLLARLLAQCASVHNVATDLVSRRDQWDCAMVFYETIDVVGHHFMQYVPPRMEHVAPQDFERFRHVVPGIYQFQDMMLGPLLDLAGPDTTVILLSDHGFHSDHLRPRVQAAVDDPHAAMDASWHRPLGVLVMSGPGIKKGQAIYGASLLDITPTALTLLGVPVGADMDGRVLVEAIDRPVQIDRVFGWDDLEGESGQHPPGQRIDVFEASSAMKQLAELGYLQALPANVQEQLELCDRETRFNLGVVLMTTGRPRKAAEVFQTLHEQFPRDPRFAMNLAHTWHSSGRHAEAGALLEKLAAEFPDLPDARILHGAALFAQGRVEEAARTLEAADCQSPNRPDLLCTLADAYTHLKRFDEAARYLEHAGKLDPHDPTVHFRKARLALARGAFEEAVEHSLSAVELRHFFPEAHYAMGQGLTWLKDYDNAIKAFKVAISMQPGMIDAYRFIASIYRHLDDRRSARPFRDAAERLLQARGQGEAPLQAALREPPLGPQDWAARLGVKDDDTP